MSATTKIGVVVTTHGNNGVFATQCLETICKYVPQTPDFTLHLVVFVNKPADIQTLNMPNVFPNAIFHFIEDQTVNGGLTATWNAGIHECLVAGCSVVVLSNNDLFILPNIQYLLREAATCPIDKHRCYGPVTNNPGPSKLNQELQFALRPDISAIQCKSGRQPHHHLNGFFMAFPAHVLQANMFNSDHYFDPNKPFDGNEVEWFTRLFARHPDTAEVCVVPRTFVYHYKLRSWRTKSHTDTPVITGSNQDLQNRFCAYTINLGQYETKILLSHKSFPFDIFYFIDSEDAVYTAISIGLLPMMVTTYIPGVDMNDGDIVRTQRALKTMPHRYLPTKYKVSVYLDGNCQPVFPNYEWHLRQFAQECDINLMCWAHPDRTTIRDEAAKVLEHRLECKCNVDAMLSTLQESGYTCDKDVQLTETNSLIRRHHAIVQFSDAWGSAVMLCRRDQLSFDFLLKQHTVSYIRELYTSRPYKAYGNTRHKVHSLRRNLEFIAPHTTPALIIYVEQVEDLHLFIRKYKDALETITHIYVTVGQKYKTNDLSIKIKKIVQFANKTAHIYYAGQDSSVISALMDTFTYFSGITRFTYIAHVIAKDYNQIHTHKLIELLSTTFKQCTVPLIGSLVRGSATKKRCSITSNNMHVRLTGKPLPKNYICMQLSQNTFMIETQVFAQYYIFLYNSGYMRKKSTSGTIYTDINVVHAIEEMIVLYARYYHQQQQQKV